MMNYQSTGRNQRNKGLKIKQVLQLTLLLAICIWLVYQMKPSDDEEKFHGANAHSKLSKESSAVVLGRKGTTGWSSDRSDSESKSANFEGKKSSNAENEKKDDVKAKSQQEMKEIATHEKIEKNEKDTVLDKYEAVLVNHEDEVSTEKGSTSAMKQNGNANSTVPRNKEMEDGVHSFHDENGIPQDLESDYQKINYYHASISSANITRMIESNAGSITRMIESNATEGEDAESQEGTTDAGDKRNGTIEGEDAESKEGVSVAENKRNGTIEESKNGTKARTNWEASTIVLEKSKVSDDNLTLLTKE